MKVHVPTSVREATTRLSGIGQLLIAKSWERAAIVFAFTEPQQGRRSDLPGNPGKLSIEAFAHLGITGLRDPKQVTAYRKAWQSAIDDGWAKPVSPGDDVELPSQPWKDYFGEPTVEVQKRVAIAEIRKNPAIIVEASKHDSHMQERIAEQVVGSPELHAHVEREVARTGRPTPLPRTWTPPPKTFDYEAEFHRGVKALMTALIAMKKGEWSPTGSVSLALWALGQLVTELAAKNEPTPSLWDDINSYLNEEAIP